MLARRVIPCLLLQERGLVKTVRFRDPRYVGDPINAVKIFNEKFVDEILFLDIAASREGREPDLDHIAQIASECFIPFCYGGGVRSIDQAARLFRIGVEKVSLNTACFEDPRLVTGLAREFGSQSVVGSMDVRTRLFGGYQVVRTGGRIKTGIDPVTHARHLVELGAGEILVNSVDRDGMMTGYDLDLLRQVADAVPVPVIGLGGAGSLADIAAGFQGTPVSALAAGSLFVFKGRHRAVLINYPSRQDLRGLLARTSGSLP